MKINKIFILLLILIFSHFKGFSQKTIKGVVTSENTPVAYALIFSNSTERPVYSDSLGNFELRNVKINDKVKIKSIGHYEKEIKITELTDFFKIELEPNEIVLDEIVINTINSSWQKLFNKPKAQLWPTAVPLLEGFSTITKYKATTDIKFNGFAVIVKNDGRFLEKKLRPLIFKDSVSVQTFLLENQVEVYNVPKNNAGKLNKQDFRIEFVFNHIIEIKKGEEIFIGIEFIPKDLENINLQGNLMLATVKEMDNPNLETKLYSFLFNDNFRGNYYKEVPLNEDLYFELKVIK